MSTSTLALVIFTITYLGIIFTRLPKINIDRPSAAFFGAVAMIVFGVLSFDEAIQAIDFNTIALLLGMMIVIATLQLDGFFSFIAKNTISLAKTEFRLLVIVTFITGLASAFLVNDAVVLLFTPVIIMICASSGLNPVPYLIAEILSSNIGSAMTITGNPQNMLIGINSGIPYARFMLHLLPVSVIGMLVSIFSVRLFYPKNFRHQKQIQFRENGFEYNYSSMKFSVPIFVLVVVLFFFSRSVGLAIPVIALIGAALILIFGRIKPSRVIREVDWVLLLFFACLFIVVRGIEKVGIVSRFLNLGILSDDIGSLGIIHFASLVASQIVSNVPFAVVMLPILKSFHSELLWLGLASASTLAGNATIIGAMANLIVIESAAAHKIKISFFEFFKVGLFTTLITLAISLLVLFTQMKLGWL